MLDTFVINMYCYFVSGSMFDFPTTTYIKAPENQGLNIGGAAGEFNRTPAAITIIYEELQICIKCVERLIFQFIS